MDGRVGEGTGRKKEVERRARKWGGSEMVGRREHGERKLGSWEAHAIACKYVAGYAVQIVQDGELLRRAALLPC